MKRVIVTIDHVVASEATRAGDVERALRRIIAERGTPQTLAARNIDQMTVPATGTAESSVAGAIDTALRGGSR